MLVKEMKICINDDVVDRPVARFVQVAGNYDSRIRIVTDKGHINAKSIMGMMTLGFEEGKLLTVEANGDDEQEAITGIEEFLAGGAR